MSSSKTFLITGASGFLGSYLVKCLLIEGHKIFATKRQTSNLYRLGTISEKITWVPIENSDVFDEIFEANNIDAIIHCATDYGRKMVAPLETLQANLILPLTLLELAAKHHVPAFINTDTALDKRINHYSLSKSQFSEWLLDYSNQVTCINVVLEHFFGPGDNDTKFVTWITTSLINRLPKLELTSGEQKRDFIYIDDVVSAFLVVIEFALKTKGGYHSFDVGSGNPVSIKQLVLTLKTLIKNTETQLLWGALPHRPNEVMSSRSDITKLQELGWNPKCSLKEGLQLLVSSELVNKICDS